MVWAHAGAPMTAYITQFHMPFFFFISVMLFIPEKCTFGQYVKQKWKKLLVPFWGWNILMFPIFFCLYYWKNWSVKKFAIGIVEILFTVNKVPFLGATWFVASLFWISVVVKLLYTALKGYKYADKIILIIGVGICICGFLVDLPYKQSRTLICCLFYILGFLYQKYTISSISAQMKNISAVIGMIVFIVVIQFNECDMGANYYKHKVLFLMGALGATIFFLRVAVFIAKKKENIVIAHLMYLGKNSLDIVIWHFLAFRIAIIIQMILYREDVQVLIAFPTYDSKNGWWIVYIIAGIYGSLVWKYILEHNCCTKFLRSIGLVRYL